MTLDYTFERRLELQQKAAQAAIEEAQAALQEARKEAEEARIAAEEAHSAGREDQLWSQIQKKQRKGKTAAQIADELETTEEEIVEIIKKRQ